MLEGGDVKSSPPNRLVDGVCSVVLINGSGCGKLNSEKGDVLNVSGSSTGDAVIPKLKVPSVGGADGA